MRSSLLVLLTISGVLAYATATGADPPRPPAIGVTVGRASFVIEPDGRVARTGNPRTLLPRAATWFPATGTWYMLERGHLVVGLGSRRLWRSRGTIGSRWQLGVIVAGPSAVAYQHDHQLWIAPLGGAERAVATAELPLGWTAGGLYTYRYRDGALLLRSDDGALVKVIGRRPLGSDYQAQGGNLYFVSAGELIGARGGRVRRLTTLARLGVSPEPELIPLGRFVELMDDRGIVVVRPDGSVFASTRSPSSRGHTDNISSALAVAPDGGAVAFTAAAGQWAQTPSHPNGVHGTETVYLLRAGARAAVPVHTEDVVFRACERGANVQWRGSWLLYSNSEGNLVAVDTAGARRAIDLTSAGRRLPGTNNGFTAYWSAQPPVL